eukprot:Rhum_TRINITY_DN14170_c4_g1::Rhum_TRINITY_DN14170_c4_g1_i1::g.72775::m.72775
MWLLAGRNVTFNAPPSVLASPAKYDFVPDDAGLKNEAVLLLRRIAASSTSSSTCNAGQRGPPLQEFQRPGDVSLRLCFVAVPKPPSTPPSPPPPPPVETPLTYVRKSGRSLSPHPRLSLDLPAKGNKRIAGLEGPVLRGHVALLAAEAPATARVADDDAAAAPQPAVLRSLVEAAARRLFALVWQYYTGEREGEVEAEAAAAAAQQQRGGWGGSSL